MLEADTCIVCNEGHDETVRLSRENYSDVNLCFYVACQEGHDEIVKYMIDKSANINSCKKDSARPLSQEGMTYTVETLLEGGVIMLFDYMFR